MRNVRIEATGAQALSIDVKLGNNVRKTWPVEAGASVDLTVEGNQKLLISAVASDELEVPTPTLDEGADVAPELPTEVEDFDVNTDADEVDVSDDEEVVGGVIDDRGEGGEDASDDHGFFEVPEFLEKGEPEKETVVITPEDASSIDVFDLPADAVIEIEQPFGDETPNET